MKQILMLCMVCLALIGCSRVDDNLSCNDGEEIACTELDSVAYTGLSAVCRDGAFDVSTCQTRPVCDSTNLDEADQVLYACNCNGAVVSEGEYCCQSLLGLGSGTACEFGCSVFGCK
jgi:hypothetical protein